MEHDSSDSDSSSSSSSSSSSVPLSSSGQMPVEHVTVQSEEELVSTRSPLRASHLDITTKHNKKKSEAPSSAGAPVINFFTDTTHELELIQSFHVTPSTPLTQTRSTGLTQPKSAALASQPTTIIHVDPMHSSAANQYELQHEASLRDAEASRIRFELQTQRALQTMTNRDNTVRASLMLNKDRHSVFYVDKALFDGPGAGAASKSNDDDEKSTNAKPSTSRRHLKSASQKSIHLSNKLPINTLSSSSASGGGAEPAKKSEAKDSSSAAAAAAAASRGDDGHEGEKQMSEQELAKIDVSKGLNNTEVEEVRLKFGFNEIAEKQTSPFIKFLSYFMGPIAYLIEAAAILSAVLEDWTDFGIIFALLAVNAVIGFVEESKAENAVNALKNTLALGCRCIRNSELGEIKSRELVPGDIVVLRLGDIVPADIILLGVSNSEGQVAVSPLQIDQAALTGESLPVSRHRGDLVYSSSIVKQGQMLGVVKAIGSQTFVGNAAHLMAISNAPGHFQMLIGKIGNFLIAITLSFVSLILIIGTTVQGHSFLDELKYALIITIASIPVGLPTVLSVTMAVGAKQLAGKDVIVKKLSAVEQMASLDILCSDKTGTLTLNQLQLDEPYLHAKTTYEELLLMSFLASEQANDAIETCIRNTAYTKLPELQTKDKTRPTTVPGYKVLAFQPFDPISKLTKATVVKLSTSSSTSSVEDEDGAVTGEMFVVAKGAPQVIQRLSRPGGGDAPVAGHGHGHDDEADEDPIVSGAIKTMASRGLRALGVARTQSVVCRVSSKTNSEELKKQFKELTQWNLCGMLSLLDPPRPDSGSTIEKCQHQGLSVKMITGDALLIAKEVSKRLGMFSNILHAKKLRPATDAPGSSPSSSKQTVESEEEHEKRLIRQCEKCDGFAQVVPEDKYRVVELLQKGGHYVGMTGDGVNDAPALKKADVGIAVHGCTDAARSAASIVLLREGLSTIVDGILVSRAIYQRMRSYALYRIASTIHFLIFLFLIIMIDNFTIPAVLIVLITLLNDAATLVISVDNVKISPKPDKWRLGQLLVLSLMIGLLLTGASFAHYYVFRDAFGATSDELGTVMYLQMSSAPHFVIFGTRLADPWYVSPPSAVFVTAILGTQVVAMLLSIYGAFSAPIGWAWSAGIMAMSFVTFFFLDVVKVNVYKYWSFELTVKLFPLPNRVDRLEKRRELEQTRKIVTRRLRKVWFLVALPMRAKKLAMEKRGGAASSSSTHVQLDVKKN